VTPSGTAAVHALPRGGTIVDTSAGAIQFGAPPETIKDALGLSLQVPEHWVPLRDWFDKRRGQSLVELEFPAYYNYFVMNRRINVVVDSPGRRRIEAVMRESFFGPERPDPHDWAPTVPPAQRVDLARECQYFARNNETPSRQIRLDDLVSFTALEGGVARLGAVEIRQVPGAFVVRDGGREVCTVPDTMERPPPERGSSAMRLFEPPSFGLTVLGSSHGFDPSGKTTGFVLWVHRRGVLVDPPVDANQVLRDAGVSPKAIDTVILTHCHADHDSGLMQKILEEGCVTVHTTPTILGSFLRKYVALTGESEQLLRRLFRFRPVVLGQPSRIHGAEFRFFYALHSIPTIGFEAFFGGRSFVYSSDTLYDPARIEALAAEGVLSPARKTALLNFPWHHSFVLHEAGVPPIHTPVARLAELPDEVKARMRLIHIAEADVPTGSGLEMARVGLDHTITFPVEVPPYSEALEMLDTLARIDLFADLNVERCREFLTVARRLDFPAGALVIREGQAGDRFYIVVDGEAEVTRGDVAVKLHGPGDFFGETALVTGAPRSADVRARTALRLLAIDKVDFLALVRGTELVDALLRLAKNRELRSWDVINQNLQLTMLTSTQKTELQAFFHHTRLEQGDRLSVPGHGVEAAYLLDTAEVVLHARSGEAVLKLGPGTFLVDVDGMMRGDPVLGLIEVVEAGDAFRIDKVDLLAFLDRAPGLMLAIAGVPFIE